MICPHCHKQFTEKEAKSYLSELQVEFESKNGKFTKNEGNRFLIVGALGVVFIVLMNVWIYYTYSTGLERLVYMVGGSAAATSVWAGVSGMIMSSNYHYRFKQFLASRL